MLPPLYVSLPMVSPPPAARASLLTSFVHTVVMNTHRTPDVLVSLGVETSLGGTVLASGASGTVGHATAACPVNPLLCNHLLLQGDLGQILLYLK